MPFCTLLLWPEAPIELHGEPFQKEALDETARLAWRGNETAAARLLKVASDSRVRHAFNLDAGGEIERMYVASLRRMSCETPARLFRVGGGPPGSGAATTPDSPDGRG